MARASPGLACGPQMSAVALELEWGTPPKSPLYSFLGNSPSLACQGEGWSRAVWYRPGHSQAVPVLPATGPMLSLAMWTPVLCPAYPCQSAQAKSSFRKFPHQLLDNCASLEPRTETVTPMSVLPPPSRLSSAYPLGCHGPPRPEYCHSSVLPCSLVWASPVRL